MSWQLLLFISVLTYSVSVIWQRVLLKEQETDPIAFTIILQLLTGIIIGGYAGLNGFKIPELSPIFWNLILMIIFYGLGNIFLTKALKLSEASEFTIIFASKIVWTIIAAVVFLGEGFSTQQVLGAFLILTGVVLGALHKSRLKIGKGEIFSLLAAATIGLAFANDAFIIRSFDAASYLSIAFVGPALAIWIFHPQATPKMKRLLTGKTALSLVILVIIFSVSALTTYLAYQIGRNAAQIATLGQISTILIVFLGVIFLKEKAFLARKILGAVLSFIGVLLVK